MMDGMQWRGWTVRVGWALLGCAVLGISVWVVVGAFVGRDFARWTGWANVWALPVGAIGVVLVVIDKVFARRTPSAPAATAPPPPPPPAPWTASEPVEDLVIRGELLDQLRRLLLATDAGPVGITGLYGAGGFGKTTLAQQASRLPELRDRFPGGLLWVTVGQEASGPGLAAIVADLVEQLTGARPGFVTPTQAGHRLGAELDKRPPILLIVDDVWREEQLEPFLVGGSACKRLFTTRVRRLLPVAAAQIEVDEMARGEAAALIARGLVGLPAPDVTTLLDVTGRWPLLMALTNGVLRRRTGQGESLESAVRSVLAQLSADGPTSLDVAVLARRERAVDLTVRASLGLLAPADQRRFLELAVFPEDVAVPDATTTLLWTGDGMSAAAAEPLRTALADLALAQRQPDGLRLHDVIRSYLRTRLTRTDLVEVNRRLIEAARPLSSGPWWRLPPAEQYLWRYLCYHLDEGERADELAATATDLHWIAAKVPRWGVAAVETDLLRVPGERSALLRGRLSKSAHLLTPIVPPTAFDDVLVARLSGAGIVAGAVSAFAAEQRTRAGLTAAWPVPDLGPAGLERVAATGMGWLNSCTTSPASDWLAVAAADGPVGLYDWSTGTLLARLTGHTDAVNAVAATYDAAWIVTASDDGTLRLWDVGRRRFERKLWSSSGQLTSCAVAPTSDRVAAVSAEGELWVGEIGSQRTVLVHHAATKLAVCAFLGDERVITSTEFGIVVEHDLRTGGSRPLIDGEDLVVSAMVVGPTGEWLALTDVRDDVLVFPLDGRRTGPSARLTGHKGFVNTLVADGDQIISGSEDGTIRVWDRHSGRQVGVVQAHTSWVTSCVLSADRRRLVSVGSDATVRIWDRDQLTQERADAHIDWVNSCTLAPDGKRLVTGGRDRTLRLWRTADARAAPIWETEQMVETCAFGPDGSWLAVGTTIDAVILRHSGGTWTPTVIERLGNFTNSFTRGVVDPDHGLIAWRDLYGGIEIMSVGDAPDDRAGHRHEKPVNAMSFLPGGRLAFADDQGTLLAWKFNQSKPHVFARDLGIVKALVAYRGRLAAVARDTVTVYDARTLRPAGSAALVSGQVSNAAVSSDGRWLATTSDTGELRVSALADLAHGKLECLAAMRVDGALYECAWAPGTLDVYAVGRKGVYAFTFRPPRT